MGDDDLKKKLQLKEEKKEGGGTIGDQQPLWKKSTVCSFMLSELRIDGEMSLPWPHKNSTFLSILCTLWLWEEFVA